MMWTRGQVERLHGCMARSAAKKGSARHRLRTARKALNDLVRQGFLVSDSPKTPVRLAFPLDYRERLLPQLFTDAPVA